MATQPSLRIGDREREAVAAELREHYAHGRLTLEEFNQRISALRFALVTPRAFSSATSFSLVASANSRNSSRPRGWIPIRKLTNLPGAE